MKNMLLVSLLLLETSALSAGGYQFRPTETEVMRTPSYGIPMPDYPAQGSSQWSMASSPGFMPGQDFMSNWTFAEPQLFEPPLDLPYAEYYGDPVGRQQPEPFFTTGNKQRWRSLAWPENMPKSADAYHPADEFMPQNSAMRTFSPYSQQADVSPGRFSSRWR